MKLKQGKGEGDLLLSLREEKILGWQTIVQVSAQQREISGKEEWKSEKKSKNGLFIEAREE